MLSTEEAARRAGIHPITLERWIAEGRIKPRVVRAGKRRYRVWAESDVERLKKLRIRRSGRRRR